MASIVQSIDVGYGGLKRATGGVDGGKIHVEVYSSVVGIGALKMSTDVVPRDTVITEIGGVRYEAGKHAALAVRHNQGRVESANYAMSPQYQALVNSALFYGEADHVDVLVLGLPNSTFASTAANLKKAMTGKHHFIRVDTSHEEIHRTVQVDEVRVIRQPIGGLVDAMFSTDAGVPGDVGDEGTKTLIIDPGYYTLDWVVADGNSPVEHRTGAGNAMGASSIYRAIQTAIQQQTGSEVDVGRIERAYADGAGTFKSNGKQFYLDQFTSEVDSALMSAMLNMQSKVQSFEDIDNIIVVGGAASLYAKALQRLIGRSDIIVARDPQYANVRGFQHLGVDYASRVLA